MKRHDNEQPKLNNVAIVRKPNIVNVHDETLNISQ